mgnify:FL=1
MREWQLPQTPAYLRLDRDELLVLDWHLSGHYLCNVGRGPDLGEIIHTWGDFLLKVWEGVAWYTENHAGRPYNLPMDESQAKYFFHWLPTTFVWGTGKDCGFSLKFKLYRFLTGQGEEDANDNQDDAQSSPKNETVTDA